MKERVEIFTNSYVYGLEQDINKFLHDTEGELIDVKITEYENEVITMIIYKPKEN